LISTLLTKYYLLFGYSFDGVSISEYSLDLFQMEEHRSNYHLLLLEDPVNPDLKDIIHSDKK
jgi:hypothetical protein